MPKTPINYSNACIYKIVCNDINITECYVGSTTNFSQRKRQHKSTCNNEKDKYYNLNVYQFIRGHGEWGNWSMVEIEKYECKDGNELKTRERYYIEHLKAELNKNIPGRTPKEYDKQYRLDNKDKINEKQNQKHNCNCGGKHTTSDRARHLKTKLHQAYIATLETN